MATDFWASSHYKRWIVDRAALQQARAEDRRYVEDPEHLDFLAIYFANVITRLSKKLQLRQRVIATATVFFRRFYLKNSYCETDPFLVISACVYVAAKAEESPVHIKNVVSDSRTIFSQFYGVKDFPSDNSKLAEMEFYLVSDLQSDLIVYHPYRTLLALCKTASGEETSDGEEGEEGEEEEEAGEVSGYAAGAGVAEGTRYWGTGEGQLVLSKEALQIPWSIINDTYRSQLCLLYPPHLIAIAALYLTFIVHPPKRPKNKGPDDKPQPRRSSRQASNHSAKSSAARNPDPITFLAQLNVSLPLIATIAQEIIAMYTLWDRYKEDGGTDAPVAGLTGSNTKKRQWSALDSPTSSSKAKHTGIPIVAIPSEAPVPVDIDGDPSKTIITTAFLSQILSGMREACLLDLALAGEGEMLGMSPTSASNIALQGSNGLPLNHKNIGLVSAATGASSAGSSAMGQQPQYAVNKMLERTMNAYG